jgi:hypothetical protein
MSSNRAQQQQQPTEPLHIQYIQQPQVQQTNPQLSGSCT